MRSPLLHPTDRRALSVVQRDKLRLRAEFDDVVAGTRRTIAQSRALLVEADAILARERIAAARSSSSGRC
jgi:hypothetical protein